VQGERLSATLLGVLLLYLLEIALVTALLTDSWAAAIERHEAAWARAWLGAEAAARAELRAARWMEEGLVPTGAVAATYRWLLPSRAERARAAGLEPLGRSAFFAFLERRLDALWRGVHRATARAALAAEWAPLLAALAAALAADGALRRKACQHAFAYPSPLLHRWALRALAALALAAPVLLVAPFPVHPLASLSAGATAAIALRTALRHTQKRI